MIPSIIEARTLEEVLSQIQEVAAVSDDKEMRHSVMDGLLIRALHLCAPHIDRRSAIYGIIAVYEQTEKWYA